MDITPFIDKLPESLTLGALAIECVKSGISGFASSKVKLGYKSITTYLKNINTKEELPKNHHLLIALRTSMLKATAYMADALTDEMYLAGITKQEQQKLTDFKKKLLGWIDTELKNVDAWVQKGWYQTEVAEKVELVLAETGNEDVQVLRSNLAQKAIAEWKLELKHGLALDLPEIVNTYLDNGWKEAGLDMDWFNIVSYWFAQLLKENDHAKDAFQNRLIAEIATEVGLVIEKLDTLLTHFENDVQNAEYICKRWDEIQAQLNRIEQNTEEIKEGVAVANEKLDRVIEYFQNKVKELENEIKEYKNKSAGVADSAIVNHINALLADKERIEKALLEKGLLIERYEKEIGELKISLKDDNDELKDKVVVALDEGKLDDAEILLLESIGAYENTEEELKAKKAESYYQLGKIKELKLEYRLALEYYEMAVKAAPQNIDSLNKAGNLSNNLGYIDNAINYLQRAINIEEKQTEPTAGLATLYSNLGIAWDSKGDYDKAIDYYEQALVIDKQYYGESHPDIAIDYNNLGMAWDSKGDYDKAIDYYEQALVIDKQYYGQSHPKIAIRYNNLGMAWYSKGEYDKAIDYYEQALAIDKQYYGQSHPQIAIRYNNLGLAWYSKGQYDKAIDYYEQASVIDKQFYGESHPNIAIRYNNLGGAWYSKGEYDKSIDYFEQALAIDKQFYGESHPQIAIRYNNLGLAWYSKGQYDKAIEYYEQALVIDKHHFGKSHPDIAIDYNNLGIAWYSKGEYEKAIDFLETTIDILLIFHDEAHPNIQTAKKSLAMAIAERNKK